MLILMTRGILISCIFSIVFFNSCKIKVQEPATEGMERGQFPDSPKNIILMIGDGMGMSQITAGMYSNNNQLALERFKVIGLQKTHSATDLVTDSAAAATAMGCGIKTCNHCLGIDADSIACKTILEEANQKGLATGLVVTSSIVHATPAAFYAHQSLRYFYEKIAIDLAESGIDFFIGGGKKHFDDREEDDRDLIKEMRDKGYSISDFSRNNLDWLRSKINGKKKVAFFTATEDPAPYRNGRLYLPDATEIAITTLSNQSDEGFFLMVEGSQIDWAGHAKKGDRLIEETLDFDRTIDRVLDFARKDGNTLVIVTADHESGGFSVNRGSTMNHLVTTFTSNGHTGAMVPVFTYGPMAESFGGIYDNTDIYVKMRNAFGWEETARIAPKN
jgi:alkaline phosphatase